MTSDHVEPAEEKGIIRRVLEGEVAAFEDLVIHYQPKVFGTARRYARRSEEVEDIVQEVFIKAFQKLSSYREDAPFEHWLMRIAVRTCYDFLRKHQRNRESHFSDLTDEGSDLLDRLAPSGNLPADQQDQDAVVKLVHDVMGQLKPASRLVLTLLDLEGKSVKEIATLTGWSISLVKVRAFRARKEMRKILESIDRKAYL